MKRLLIICTISLFYLAACSNNDTHTHDGDTHSHEDGTEHADHDHAEGDDHAHPHDADHDHEQEEFSVEADSLGQDSINNQ
jgi:hypothetical protein